MESPVKVILFDLDGTLMVSGGAGQKAINAVFADRYGIQDAFGDIVPHGMMDPVIFQQILDRFGITAEDRDALLAELAEDYAERLEPIMREHERARLMPGVVELLEALHGRDHVLVGLVTGNYEKTGRIKLDRFGLNKYFDFGAFSSDHPVRADLVPVAVARAEAIHGGPIGLGRHVVLVGDTPKDVEAALINGVTSVAVATLGHTVEQLGAEGAHFVFEDFSDTAAVLAAMGVS
ncbi:MAG: HAD family hydrolase [Deltaproteobacteria bacterium]|nr:HAD family hydrolase [bacterium]MCB9487856.1 HAD family hydrolase [Deltaproteobacteria bacterium]